MEFKNLQEAIHYFKDEQFCKDQLANIRWPDGRVVCPKCGQKGAYQYVNIKAYKCKSVTCKNKFSVTTGTIYENTKLPLSKWFVAMYLISAHKKGISSCQLARDLGIGQKAGWFLLHRIRTLLIDKSPELLTDIVEVDETMIGGKWKNKSNKKKREKKALNGYTPNDEKEKVMGFVQRDQIVIIERPHKLIPGKTVKEKVIVKDGRAIFRSVGKKVMDDTFKEMVRKQVAPDSVLVTDAHSGYTGLDKEYLAHGVVNHSIDEYERDGYHTNTVEGLFSFLKRSIIGTYHQVSAKHLISYCNENAYRYTARKLQDAERFKILITKTDGRLKYKDLTKN